MNNINQKNVIYQMKPSNGLPYQQVEWINHLECCETINEVDINNLANQLVDNDAYVEQYLNHVSSYIVGPKAYDETAISSMPNGYKVFGQLKGTSYLPILHKVEKPLQETLTKLQAGEVSVMKKFGDLIVANIQGVAKCTYDPVNGSWEILHWHNGEIETTVNANDIYTSDVGCFIAADSGIFQLVAETEYDDKSQRVVEHHSLVKLDSGSSSPQAKCIAVDSSASKVYVGCNQGSTKMLVGDYQTTLGAGNAEQVVLEPVELYAGHDVVDDQINDIEVLPETGEVIAAGNTSLYARDVQNYLQNKKVLSPTESVSFTSSIQYNGRIFFGTSESGLWYKADDGNLARLTEIDGKIVKLVQGNGKLYVAAESTESTESTESKIYVVWPDFSVQKESFSGHGTIKSIEVVGSCVVAATDSGVWCYDASISNAYVFKMLDLSANDIKYYNGYLALAGDSALSTMALSSSSSAEELPIINGLEEVPIVGIDGSGGESGFLKFISVAGYKLAVFETKIQCLGDSTASYNASKILNVISLGSREDIGYLAVSLEDGLDLLSFDGSTFDVERSFSEILSADNLAYVDDLIVASDSSLCALSSWRLGDYDFLNSDPWTSIETTSKFTDVKACGLCAICQVSSTGLSAFEKTSVAEKISSDSMIGEYKPMDACAVDQLSTQFLTNSGTPAKAFILSSLSGEDAGFAGPVTINDANAKMIEVIQDPDDMETHYAYELNSFGKLCCYQLTKQLSGDQLTGFSSAKLIETSTTYTDLQKVTSRGIDGALLTKDKEVYVHFPALSAPASILASPVGCVVPVFDEGEGGSPDHQLIYGTGGSVMVSSITTGQISATPLSSLTGDVDKVQIGLNGLYAKHGQTVAMTYTPEGEAETFYDMQYDTGEDPKPAALVTDFAVCGFSKEYGAETAERDVLVATIDNQLHVVDLNGITSADFSNSTIKQFIAGATSINSIAVITSVKPNEDTTTAYIAVAAAGTDEYSNQIAVFKLEATPPQDINQPMAIQLVYVWVKFGVEAKKVTFDRDQNLVYLDAANTVHVHPIEIADSTITIQDETDQESNVEDIFQESREDNEWPSTWIHTGTELATVEGERTLSVDQSFICNSIGTSFNGMVSLASVSGLSVSLRSMVSSDIKTNFTAPQQLKSASYSGGFVFIAGTSGGLSCYPFQNPTQDNLTCLNDSTTFTRCHAFEADDVINLVAWTDHEVFTQTYDIDGVIEEGSFESSAVLKKFQNIDIDYVMTPSDQLIVPAPPPAPGEEEETRDFINVFAELAAIQDSNYDGYFFGTDNGLHYDNGYYELFAHDPDNSIQIVKFIQQDEYVGQLAYISSDSETEVLLYPSGDELLSVDLAMKDAILYDSKWYYIYDDSTNWTYQPLDEEMDFPQYNANDVAIGGATIVDGSMLFGTNYGILKASYVKQQIVGEDRDVMPLSKNFAWDASSSFKSLNQSIGFKMMVVTELSTESSSSISAYENDIRSTSVPTSDLLVNFYPPSGEGDDPVSLEDLWCVNQSRILGMFCQPVRSGEDDYTRWLNAISGTKLYPYTGVDEDSINSVSKHSDGYYLLCDGRVVYFSKYGTIVVFQQILGTKHPEANFNHMVKANGNRLLMVGNGGLATYSNGQFGMIKIKDGIDVIDAYVVDGHAAYLHNNGSAILSSSNYKIWKPFLTLPTEDVTDATCLNKQTYLFATPTGLYGTKYQFDLVNDVVPMTKDKALSVYDDLVASSLSSKLSTALSTHLSTDHLSSSFITHLNEDYATTELDDISPNWQRVVVSSDGAADLGIKNDIIAEMTFGTGLDGDVVAQISNFLDPEDSTAMEEISTMTYITKRWMSGMTDIFINVPTTRTYYLNNLLGASDCKLLPSTVSPRKNLEEFGVEKLEQSGVLSDHYTFLQIGLASAEYSVNKLVDVQINGMSLPLKIYKEKPASGSGRLQDNLYRSFIEPSVGRGYNIETTNAEGNWTFNFACFGTDAQAIHLMFYDERARSGGSTVKVVFDPNGGDGVMAPEKFMLVKDEDGYLVPEQKPLKKCRLTNTSAGYEKIFAGWSIQPLADNETPTYEDGQTFPNSTNWIDLANELEVEVTDVLKHKDEIKLYAVWLTYQFSENDTTLVFNSNKSEFAIDSVGVDESTNLKDKVVINWGD